jgi:hypothetical protein
VIELNYNEFIIKIDFEKGSENPSRIFTAMAGMIDTFNKMDMVLAKSLAADIESILILEDIESGSIKTRLCSALKLIDDEALKELDWKKAIGSFLVKGKYKIIKFLEKKNVISSIEEINELEKDFEKLIDESCGQGFPFRTKVNTHKLLESMLNLSKANSNLSNKDKAMLISNEGKASINTRFYISTEMIEELLTRHVINKQIEMILLVKKPDYLGYSMWDVQYSGRTVQAKIMDLEWLQRFQSREVDMLPGDSLRAIVHLEIKYGDNNIIVGEHYSVLKVIEIYKKVRYIYSKLIE